MNTWEKSVTRTVRLNVATTIALAEEALRGDISWNTLVNRILVDYVKYETFAKRARIMRIGPRNLSFLLNEIPDETIAALARKRGGSNPPSMLALMGLPHTLENVTLLITKFMDKYYQWCDGSITETDEMWMVHLRHILNHKWSIYLCEYVTAMLEKFGFERFGDADIQDYSVTISMKRPAKREGGGSYK